MKKYLLVGLVLIFTNVYSTARAADSCSFIGIANALGSPRVVFGNTVNFVATGIAPLSFIYLDGVSVVRLSDVISPPGTFFQSSGPISNVPFGSHTLRIDSDPCQLNFSNVPVPATPGVPSLSTNRTLVRPNQPYILSWTVPSGSINHYILHRDASGGSVIDNTLPGNSSSITLTSSAPPGLTKFFTFTIRACATGDETSCSAWSNAVVVEVDAPCVGGCP
jgi:hypothetical protein